MTTTSSPPRLNQAEYAKARGWAKSYVTKLKGQGLLVMADGLVDVVATDALIAQYRDPARGGDRSAKPAAAAGQPTAGALAPTPAAPGTLTENPAGATLSYQEAARRERIAKARLAELELAEAAEQLLKRDVVRTVWFTLARQAQQALLTMKYRLAAPLAVETDPRRISEMLDGEARSIIQLMVSADPCKESPEDEES